MIYINRRIDMKFMTEMLNISRTLKGRKIALWKYQNSRNGSVMGLWDELIPFLLARQTVEAVTLHTDSDKMREVECYTLNERVVKLLTKQHETLVDVLDSVSVYKNNAKKWFSCMIFHEQMTLLRLSVDETEILRKQRIAYTETPPDWW